MLKGKFAALLAGAGLMLLAHAAQANVFNVVLQPGPGSTGTYQASVDRTGDVWTVLSANAGGGAPSSNGDVVRLYFLDGGGNATIAGTGAATGGVDGGGTNWGPFYNVLPGGGQVYSQWDTIAVPANELLANNGNTFKSAGGITATGGVNAIIEILAANGQTWVSPLIIPPVVPEGSSLAMLLPALAPLGMVLRRRRASRK